MFLEQIFLPHDFQDSVRTKATQQKNHKQGLLVITLIPLKGHYWSALPKFVTTTYAFRHFKRLTTGVA